MRGKTGVGGMPERSAKVGKSGKFWEVRGAPMARTESAERPRNPVTGIEDGGISDGEQWTPSRLRATARLEEPAFMQCRQ